MEEKEAVRRIRNSFKAGMSRSQITSKLQEKGYRLDYIDALISRARRRRRIGMVFLTLLIIMISLSTATYALFFTNEKQEIENPLNGLNLKLSSRTSAALDTSNNSEPTQTTKEQIDAIQITPEFISYLLNEVGAWQLRTNPLTLEKPIINFKIGEETFTSTISKEISTIPGLSDKADIQFNGDKTDLIYALDSASPEEVFKESLAEGRTTIEVFASESELFAKGYLKLYNELGA